MTWYRRIKMQQQRLAQEMQDAAVVSLIQKRPKMKASRSLPAMVLKHVPKTRVSSTYNELNDQKSDGKECLDLVYRGNTLLFSHVVDSTPFLLA